MLDTKKLIIVSVVAIAVLGGAGYHLMQKMKYKNVDEQQVLSKSNNEAIIAGKTVELDKSKDYDILIKRTVENGKDFLLRDILSEKEYQYLKTAYFKKIDDKLLGFEKRREGINKKVADAVTQSKKELEIGNVTKKEYDEWYLSLKKMQTKTLHEIEQQEDYFISKKPFLERYELVQLIDDFYKGVPSIQTKNNDRIRSLTLSQILEPKSVSHNTLREILLNIKKSFKDSGKNRVTLKDFLPKYKAELYFRDLLHNPRYKTKNRNNKLSILRNNGLNSEIYGEYLSHMYITLDKKSTQFQEIKKEVTKLFTPENIEILEQKIKQKSI
jgi:hypothetical protein